MPLKTVRWLPEWKLPFPEPTWTKVHALRREGLTYCGVEIPDEDDVAVLDWDAHPGKNACRSCWRQYRRRLYPRHSLTYKKWRQMAEAINEVISE